MLGQLLAQFELKGRDLHGVQADGGVIGQRRARVHESQRHGLQQLKVQVLEESRYFKLHKENHKSKFSSLRGPHNREKMSHMPYVE